MANKAAPIAGTAGAGLVIGFAGGNTEAANRIVDAILRLIDKISSDITSFDAVLILFLCAIMAGCWIRTGQTHDGMVTVSNALLSMSEAFRNQQQVLHNVLERHVERRSATQKVEHERRGSRDSGR